MIDGVVVIDRDYYNTKEEQFKQVRLMLTDNTSMYNRVFQKNTFFKKIKSTTHQALARGLV